MIIMIIMTVYAYRLLLTSCLVVYVRNIMTKELLYRLVGAVSHISTQYHFL